MSEFQEYYVDRWVPDVELEAKLNSRPNCDLVHVFRNPASPGSVETTTLVWKIREIFAIENSPKISRSTHAQDAEGLAWKYSEGFNGFPIPIRYTASEFIREQDQQETEEP